ncbi:MAG TPA: hypothetical protein VGH11_04160 [Jatrophihabitans sp.]|jgi:hypothetical protein
MFGVQDPNAELAYRRDRISKSFRHSVKNSRGRRFAYLPRRHEDKRSQQAL